MIRALERASASLRGQVLTQLGRLLVDVGEDPVEVPVLGQQLGGGLLPHARDARKVVRGVPAECGQQDYSDGSTPQRSMMPASS